MGSTIKYERAGLCVLLFLSFLLAACEEKPLTDAVPDGFKADVMLKYTPVKNQGQSELCWVYAMLATIETEHIMQGDSVNLSAEYLGRMYLEEKAAECFQSKGEKSISLRGIGPMALQLIQKYGVTPYESFNRNGGIDFNLLAQKVEDYVQKAIKKGYTEEEFMQGLRQHLDDETDFVPRKVFMEGAQYTTLEFAHSVCMRNEYSTFMCNPDKPLNTMQDPELDDNHYHCKAMNIKADQLVKKIKDSLHDNHPVMWEGGPNDNHAVAIIGMGKDKRGNLWFVAKNSWGETKETAGMMYIPETYIENRTALIVSH